jgi:uncharacterized protein GlcG (DUF336 family)
MPVEEKLKLEVTQRIIEAAKSKAEELNIKEDIAIVDAGGNLKAFARMDGAWLGTIDIVTQPSAYTSCYHSSGFLPTVKHSHYRVQQSSLHSYISCAVR